MDLRVPSDKTTGIGRGQYNPAKKYLGLYYITATSNNNSGKSGRHAHSTVQCRYVTATKEYQRTPVFEIDGIAYWEDKTSGRHHDQKVSVLLCENCPPYLDSRWMKGAACLNSEDPRAFITNSPVQYNKFIEDSCSRCPVVVDCFEYGAGTDSVGVWGGVFLPMDDERRRDRIRERREELDTSGVRSH